MPAAPVNQYDVARTKATENANATAQTQNDAIRRRFASLGNLNSGAAIKQQQIAADQSEKNKSDALSSINAAEATENSGRDFQREQQKAQQDFQARESGLGRDFSGGQSAMDRALQEKMQAAGFDFTGKQGAMNRAFQGDMASSAQSFEKGQRQIDRDQQAGIIAEQMKQQGSQFQKQFDADQGANYLQSILSASGVTDDALRNQLLDYIQGGGSSSGKRFNYAPASKPVYDPNKGAQGLAVSSATPLGIAGLGFGFL